MLLWEGKWAIVAVLVWAKQTRLRVLEQLTVLMQMMPTARCLQVFLRKNWFGLFRNG